MSNPWDEAKRLLMGEEITTSAPFMTNRILSFNPTTFVLAREHNGVIGKIPKTWSDKIFQCSPKSNKVPFLRYAKKKKEKEPQLVQKVSEYFCVNKHHADQIIEILRRQGKKPEQYFGLEVNK